MKHYTPYEIAALKKISHSRVCHDLMEGRLDGYKDEKGHWLIPEPIALEYIHRQSKRLSYEGHIAELDILLKQVEKNS